MRLDDSAITLRSRNGTTSRNKQLRRKNNNITRNRDADRTRTSVFRLPATVTRVVGVGGLWRRVYRTDVTALSPGVVTTRWTAAGDGERVDRTSRDLGRVVTRPRAFAVSRPTRTEVLRGTTSDPYGPAAARNGDGHIGTNNKTDGGNNAFIARPLFFIVPGKTPRRTPRRRRAGRDRSSKTFSRFVSHATTPGSTPNDHRADSDHRPRVTALCLDGNHCV